MSFPPHTLQCLPCWQADVDIAATEVVGAGPTGTRNIVPILGGRFEGQLAPETATPRPFRGIVRPGGWDLQRVREDGCKELEAIYHMETHDGTVIEIRNLALVTYDGAGQLDYARSRIFVEAPEGPYAWLNARVFVGSVEVIRPQAQVRIRSWVVV